LRCASRTLPDVLIFGCRPGLEAVEFRALEELFAVAAVDMEGTVVARVSSWAGLDLWLWEAGAICGGERATSSQVRAAQGTQWDDECWRRHTGTAGGLPDGLGQML